MLSSKTQKETYKWLETNLKKSGLLEINTGIPALKDNNQWFASVDIVNTYSSNLKEILEDLINLKYKKKTNSFSRDVLKKITKEFPEQNSTTNFKECITNSSNLAKRLKRTTRLSFFVSFDASLNSKESIELLKKCGSILDIKITQIKRDELAIDMFSGKITSCLKYLKKRASVEAVIKIFNDKIVTEIENCGWIFRSTPLESLIISKIDQYKQITAAWKPEKISTNDMKKAREELLESLQKLKSIISLDKKHLRYSVEFGELVDEAINHISNKEKVSTNS